MRTLPLRQDRVFLGLLAAYFALQAGLRLLIGGALETDEAEMMLLTPGWQLGYGPQLPLYGWMQMAGFSLFGRGVLALAVVKNLALLLTYLFAYAGFRLMLAAPAALVATLALALLPDLFWEGQRATTHSVALMLMLSVTLWAVARVLTKGRPADYVILGIAMGLGGLAKYNYWLVPPALALAAASLPDLRQRLVGRRLLSSAAIAAAILAAPVAWMIGNPDLAAASVYKLTLPEAAVPWLPWIGGLFDTATGLAAGLGLAVLVPLGLRLLPAGPVAPPSPEGRLFARFLARAAALALAGFALGVILAGATGVTARWMIPVFFLAAPPLLLWSGAAAGGLRQRGLLAIVAVLALLTLVGMGAARLAGDARGAVDFAAVEAEIARFDPAARPILADFYLGGNLKWRNPDWDVAAFLPTAAPPAPGKPVLILTRGPAVIPAILARAGWPAPDRFVPVESHRFSVPYRFAPDQALAIEAHLVAPAP